MKNLQIREPECPELRCLCGAWLNLLSDSLHCDVCGADYCAECGGRVARMGGCTICLSCGASRCEN